MDDHRIASQVIVALKLEPGGTNAPDYVDFAKRRLPGLLVAIGDVLHWHVGGRSIAATIEGLEGSGNFAQRLKIERQQTDIRIRFAPHSASRPIGQQDGISDQFAGIIRSMFNDSAAFRALGMPMVKSMLIHGVSGVGKNTTVRRVCYDMGNCHLIEISTHDLLRLKDEFESPEFVNYNPLTLAVTKAIACAPSVLVIKDLDDLMASNSKSMADRVADLIRKQVARIADEIKVCVVGLARDLTALPDGIKKSDIFGEHLHIPIPTMQQRTLILKDLLADYELERLTDSTDDTNEEYAKQIALRTSGYVARDLKALCKIAVLKSLRDEDDLSTSLSRLSLEDGKKSIRWADLEYAMATVRPSQQMQVESSPPKRSWDELGGYESIKRKIRQAALLPLLQPQLFSQLGVKPPSGILLYGPSGCGKTAFVQALASESMLNFISIKGPEIFSKYLGETEHKIRRLFATAKRISPCIMFIDEMDAISTRRGWDSGDSSGGVNERVLSTLLNEMDGVEGRKGVIVIGCTNRPDQIDDAILRPGRLDQLVYMGLPDRQDRQQIMDALVRRLAISSDISLDELSRRLKYCTGADIENLFREAGTLALRRDILSTSISADDIEGVVDSVCDRAKHRVVEGKSLGAFETFNKAHALQ